MQEIYQFFQYGKICEVRMVCYWPHVLDKNEVILPALSTTLICKFMRIKYKIYRKCFNNQISADWKESSWFVIWWQIVIKKLSAWYSLDKTKMLIDFFISTNVNVYLNIHLYDNMCSDKTLIYSLKLSYWHLFLYIKYKIYSIMANFY